MINLALMDAYSTIEAHPVGHLGTDESASLITSAIAIGALIDDLLRDGEGALGCTLPSLARRDGEAHDEAFASVELRALSFGIDDETASTFGYDLFRLIIP